MIRFASAAAVLAAALAVAPAALARDIRETRTFARADGTEVAAGTGFHTRTGVVDAKAAEMRADGRVRTVSEKISPDHGGGFTVSRPVTGFDGQTRGSARSVGTGRASASTSSGSHAGRHGRA